MGAYLTYYDTLTIVENGDEEAILHPLARRMTPIQRAGVGIFARAGRLCADRWEAMLTEGACEVLFTTVYGEVSANYGVSHAVAHQCFPLSPKDFGHSLNNATAGYLALTQKLTGNVMTITHGFLSVDKALAYAAHLLARGPCRHVVVVHANEYLWPDTPLLAKAEILLLSCTKDSAPHQPVAAEVYELLRFASVDRPPHDDCFLACEKSPGMEGAPLVSYFDLPRDKELYRRCVIDRDGEGLFSEWRRCSAT